MIYRTTKCPICHNYIDVLKPTGDDYGSPFVICPNCKNTIIDREKSELALKTKKTFYSSMLGRLLMSFVATTLTIGLFAGLAISAITNTNEIYTWQTVIIGLVVASIFLLIRLNNFASLWRTSPEIEKSITRLKSDTYRCALIKNNIAIETNCIFDILTNNFIINRDLRDKIIASMYQYRIFDKNRSTYILNDVGIFDNFYIKYLNSINLSEIKRTSTQQYLRILVSHAFSAGLIVGHHQNIHGSNESFTYSEKCTGKIKSILDTYDPYQYALEIANNIDNNMNSQYITKLVDTALSIIQVDFASRKVDDITLKDYMRIMYDIGYSYAIQR